MTNATRLLLRIPVPWVFVIGYLIGVLLESRLPSHADDGAVATAIGAALFLAGAAIAGWGLLLFKRAHTTTVPGRTSAQLVTWGPYEMTRNPMYVGLTLAYFGEAGLLHQLWPIVILPCVLAYVNGVVIPLEESRLRDAFGDRYDAYCGRVRRWI